MIPSPALQLTSPVAMPGAVLPGNGGEAADGADFAALLALSSVPAALPAALQPDLAVADPAIATPSPIAAEPAIVAATPGKILPVGLPLAALPAALGPETPEADQAQTRHPHSAGPVAHLLPLTAQAGKSRAAALRANAGDNAPTKDVEPEVPLPTAVLTPELPQALHQSASALPQPAQQAAPAVPSSAAETIASAEPALARALPLQAAAPAVRTLTERSQARQNAAQQAAASPATTPQNPAPPTAALVAAPAPPPLTQVRLDVPLPQPLRPARFETARAAPMLAAALGDVTDALAAAFPASALAAVPPAAFSAATPAPLDRPHDFSALIDRLAAARETAAPQSVSISLPHADFGRIQLNFRSEDGALAVSLASADPDFARIAAQSAPAVLIVSEARTADHTPGQGSARSDGQAANASPQGGQRGQSDERRSERQGERQARFEHLPRSASPDKGRGRSGIFA